MEEGYEVIETGFPALITVVKEINEPRLPSLKGMVRAKKAEIHMWNASDIACEKSRIGQSGSPTIVNKIFTPPPRKGGETILGDPEEQAQKLVEKLRQAKVV
ncbi:Caffeyl-CoA reductase-Etf complex subunit CarD [subsurface metagenome]